MKSIIYLLIALPLVFSGCTESHIDPEALIEEELAKDDDDVVVSKTYYTSEIANLLDTHCTSCHGGGRPTAGLTLEGYQNARQSFEFGDSFTWVKSTTNPMPPSPNSPLTTAEIALLVKWQNDGFLEQETVE